MRPVRVAALVVSGFLLLGGLVAVGVAFLGARSPVDWLDRNLERTGENAWLSQQPVMATAEDIAGGVAPASRVVNTWGVALRYGAGTITVAPGPREGTASVYWDSSSTRRRHYHFGRYAWSRGGAWDDDDIVGGGGAGRWSAVPAFDADVRTRRGEGFRGGGPGGGK